MSGLSAGQGDWAHLSAMERDLGRRATVVEASPAPGTAPTDASAYRGAPASSKVIWVLPEQDLNWEDVGRALAKQKSSGFVVLNIKDEKAWSQAAAQLRKTAPKVRTVWPVKLGQAKQLDRVPAEADIVGIEMMYDPAHPLAEQITGEGGLEDVTEAARKAGKKVAIRWGVGQNVDAAAPQWVGHMQDQIAQINRDKLLAWEVWHETRATKTKAPQVARAYREAFKGE